MEKLECTRCERSLPLDQFRLSPRKRYLSRRCTECREAGPDSKDRDKLRGLKFKGTTRDYDNLYYAAARRGQTIMEYILYLHNKEVVENQGRPLPAIKEKL